MPEPRLPIITLTTDFGGADHYVGAVKAAILSVSTQVAIVDISGDLVYFEKMDGTQAASVTIAVDKARAAARFKRPTKALQDALAAGGEGLRILGLQEAVPVEGGVPIIMDGKIVGAVGVSGVTSAQDGQCANAGAASVK